MEKRYNFIKDASHLCNLCSDDFFHPVLRNIKFEENNAIATNGHVLLIIPVIEISNLSEDDIEKLNGKAIDRTAFKNLLKYPFITKIEDDGICARDVTNFCEVKFRFSDCKHYPDYKKVMKVKQHPASKEIAFKASLLNELCNVVGDDTPRITLNANFSILIRFKESKAKGLIAPYCIDQNELENKK